METKNQHSDQFDNIIEKIRGEHKLTESEKGLIQKRMFTPNEVSNRCPNGTIIVSSRVQVEAWTEKMPNYEVITAHQSQGKHFENIMYVYDKTHSLGVVLIALSRAKSFDNLFMITEGEEKHFFHG